MNELVRAALAYQVQGFSVVPVKADKSSMGSWREYQKRIISVPDTMRRFAWRSTAGVAIVCGSISGNLGVIDIDLKNDLSGRLYPDFIHAVNRHSPGLMNKMVIAQTRNLGYHVFYRTSVPSRYVLLARRPTTPEERKLDPDTQALVLIESLGENRYVLVQPSPGYQFIQGGLSRIVTLSPNERDILFNAARALNTYFPRKQANAFATNSQDRQGSPLDDYDLRGDVVKLLEKHRWEVLSDDPDRVYLRRPGKTQFKSSGDYHRLLNRFKVFTTKTPFDPSKSYRPSAVYALLECGDDFTVAAKRLLAEGYGIPYRMMIK